ncbi:MAG TPA: cupin domain-containing protein [Solirubrobacterales bacterium]|jgi:quercetin dioxygenase-like cupin family protein
MQTVTTGALELMEGWQDSDADGTRVRFNFPINKLSGAESSAVVYFELEPGQHLGRHTDSAEETLYIVAGTAEAEAGGERQRVAAGDMVVIPAMAPHGVANVGDDTVKVVGFFSAAEVTSTFEEPMQPVGASVFEQAAPAPA